MLDAAGIRYNFLSKMQDRLCAFVVTVDCNVRGNEKSEPLDQPLRALEACPTRSQCSHRKRVTK